MTARVIAEIVRDRVNQVTFLVVSGLVALGYSILLPFAFTQRLSLHNWHYLDGRYLAFSLAFGLSIGWLLTLQLYAVRRVMHQRGVGLGGTAAAVGVLPSLLCCTPIVPTLLGLFGVSGASLSQTSGGIQSFFANQQNLILASSLAVILIASLWATRRIIRAACLDRCDTPVDASQGDAATTPSTAPHKSPTRARAIAGSR
jgi:hypothetical protein